MEKKTNGSISTEYDVNLEDMYQSYIDQGIEEEQMLNYIRDEYLNSIIARKQFVKDSKEKRRNEKKNTSTAAEKKAYSAEVPALNFDSFAPSKEESK